MSLFKGFQILSFLGAASSAPFIPSIATGEVIAPSVELTSGGGNLASANAVIEPKVESKKEKVPVRTNKAKPSEVMDAAQEMMDDLSGGITGEKKCFWWPKAGVELLGCVYLSQLGKIFLFHYEIKNQLLNPIVGLTNSSGVTQMKFKDDKTSRITGLSKLALAWWYSQKSDQAPTEHCRLTSGIGSNNYNLTCDNGKAGEAEKQLVNQNVSLESLKDDKYKSQIK